MCVMYTPIYDLYTHISLWNLLRSASGSCMMGTCHNAPGGWCDSPDCVTEGCKREQCPSKEWLDHAIRLARIYREVRFQSPAQMQLCAAVDEIERLTVRVASLTGQVEGYKQAIADQAKRSAAEPKRMSTVQILREIEDTLIEIGWHIGWHKDRGVLKRVSDCLDEIGRALSPIDPLGTETRAATSRDARSTEDAGRSRPSPPPRDGQ